MCPITHTSFLALGAAVAASFIFGFLWYGPIFGKTWAQLMGFKMDDTCKGKPPISSLLITIIGTALTTLVMAYALNTAKVGTHFATALFIWLGFYIPLSLGSVTWEGKPWKLFALNIAYSFLSLQLIAAILTYLR